MWVCPSTLLTNLPVILLGIGVLRGITAEDESYEGEANPDQRTVREIAVGEAQAEREGGDVQQDQLAVLAPQHSALDGGALDKMWLSEEEQNDMYRQTSRGLPKPLLHRG